MNYAELKRLEQLARLSAGKKTELKPDQIKAGEKKLGVTPLSKVTLTVGGQVEAKEQVEEAE